MLRTNSKAVRTKVCQYIVDNYTPENYDFPESDNVHFISRLILKTALEEKKYSFSRNQQETLIDWMQGLPSLLYTWPLLADANNVVGDWLEQTEEERWKYSRMAASNVALNLISMAIIREAAKYANDDKSS